jgi:hypothetical protein
MVLVLDAVFHIKVFEDEYEDDWGTSDFVT